MSVNVLVVLIGSNPLPNFVVCSYLLKRGREDVEELPKPDKFIFVASKDTLIFAKKIIQKLNIEESTIYANLNEDQRNPGVIRNKVNEALEKIEIIDTIHLNYTGGTKPMAVHSYIAVNNFARKKSSIRLILSDLDPVNKKIIIAKTSMSYPNLKDLNSYVKLRVEDIINLHELEVKNKGSKCLTYSRNIMDIKVFKDEMFAKKDNINHALSLAKKGIKNSDQMKKELLSQELAKKYIYKGNIPFNDKKTIKQFFDFFIGKWLEDYILEILKDLHKIEDLYSGIRKGFEGHKNNKKMEIDIILMKGFQMFLITCTTSRKISTVKHKAFEGLYRAEQMGGEHSKVIVVSCMYEKIKNGADIQDLKKDISQFDAAQNCEFISINDLKDENKLKQKLLNIIKG